jgi:hypothetical protein
LFWLGVLAGGGYGAYRVLGQRQSQSAVTPEWPPLPAKPEQPTAKVAAESSVAAPAEAAAASDQASAGQRWRPPINGDCPDGYPLKANDNSRIFHSPGGRFYARTVAERCYANADDAIADGYRPAKA